MTNSLASFLVTHLKGLLLLSKRAAVGLVRSKFLYYMPGNSREQTLDACLRKKLRGSVQSSIFLFDRSALLRTAFSKDCPITARLSRIYNHEEVRHIYWSWKILEPGFLFSLFFGNCERSWLIGNGTLICVVQYCKSRSSDFVNHSYDHRPKWSPLGPISIMFNWSWSFILPYKALCIFPWFDKISFVLHPSRTTKTTNCTSA